MDSTNRGLQAGGEGGELLQHGVGAVLERLVQVLRVLRVGERVELLADGLLELDGVLLEVLQRGRGGRVTLHQRRLRLWTHTQRHVSNNHNWPDWTRISRLGRRFPPSLARRDRGRVI